jgi:hypothetical protein
VERAGLDWWAFQPVVRPALPEVEGRKTLGAIDALVRARLAEREMEPAPSADRRTLIKRLYFDLSGLVPTAGEIEIFVNDEAVDAVANLVDGLLASERFGERWGRHWLDVVRYAETNGYERDAVKPNLWKYRDWVIRAFNEDMPYDQFVREQLAGDEIAGRDESSVIATGMLCAGTWNDEPNDAQDYMYERLEDMVDVVTTAFLGVTVKCARCHDHKFDPIPQRDYYRIAAVFWPGAVEARDRALMGGPTAKELGIEGVFGWTDIRRNPPPLHLLVNGEAQRKGEIVEPGVLSLVPLLDKAMVEAPESSKTTQRRAQLAEFIVDRRNPLTARVMVNRIWQHLFGRGILRTPNNFGFKASPPTHPELLDWLAAEFLEGDWKVKGLIREIVLSETYRQSSVHPRETEYALMDASNALLWKMNRRRRDAEGLRDAMLQAAGNLNLKMGGPSFYPEMAPEALEGFSRKGSAWKVSGLEERRRRSVYMVSKRHLLLPLMTAFDFPNSEKPCGRRDVTTVAPQALAMLNNHFVHAQSESLAKRVLESDPESSAALRMAWRQVLGRDPGGEELVRVRRHYEDQGAHFRALDKAPKIVAFIPVEGRALWLRADRGTSLDAEGRVWSWADPSARSLGASQPDARRRPLLVAKALHGKPVIRFHGARQFLQLGAQIVHSQDCTIIAVAKEQGDQTGHRSLFSNWNGAAGNSVNSLFLGLTGQGTVRFSDNFRSEQVIGNPREPFVLAASTGRRGTRILHNGVLIGNRSTALANRNLAGPYVIGQQGNIDGEYWKGDLAELLVYDRQLSEDELRGAAISLAEKYGIVLGAGIMSAPERSPEFLALASVCHVLLNTNEFLYVD